MGSFCNVCSGDCRESINADTVVVSGSVGVEGVGGVGGAKMGLVGLSSSVPSTIFPSEDRRISCAYDAG